MSQQAFTLAELIGRGMENRLLDVHTAIPVRVVKYDESTQKVDVQPLIKRAFTDETEQRIVQSLPVIPSVPVVFPGAGKWRMTFPITTQTTGCLIFCEASLDQWLQQGGEVDPLDDRKHSLADGMFYPGLRDFAHALKSAPVDRMTIGDDEGNQIHIDSTSIKIGSNIPAEIDKVVLSTVLSSFLNSFTAVFTAHVHPTTAPGSPTGITATPAPTVPNIESQTVFAKK